MSLHCGYRFFECERCGHTWKEKCRDAETPSCSSCPLEDCHCVNSPIKNEKHPEWKTDMFGNLIEPNLYIGAEIWEPEESERW